MVFGVAEPHQASAAIFSAATLNCPAAGRRPAAVPAESGFPGPQHLLVDFDGISE
jgi:hypothetical protein